MPSLIKSPQSRNKPKLMPSFQTAARFKIGKRVMTRGGLNIKSSMIILVIKSIMIITAMISANCTMLCLSGHFTISGITHLVYALLGRNNIIATPTDRLCFSHLFKHFPATPTFTARGRLNHNSHTCHIIKLKGIFWRRCLRDMRS